jgi:hypothetical protein
MALEVVFTALKCMSHSMEFVISFRNFDFCIVYKSINSHISKNSLLYKVSSTLVSDDAKIRYFIKYPTTQHVCYDATCMLLVLDCPTTLINNTQCRMPIASLRIVTHMNIHSMGLASDIERVEERERERERERETGQFCMPFICFLIVKYR